MLARKGDFYHHIFGIEFNNFNILRKFEFLKYRRKNETESERY